MPRLLPLALLFCAACGSDRRFSATAPSAPALSARSAIIPAERGAQVRWLGYVDAVNHWSPDPADVAPLESGLHHLLEQAAADPAAVDEYAVDRPESQQWIRGEIEQILPRLDDYRLQFIGVIDASGTRRILVRAFAGPAFDSGFDFENWRDELAIVSDGGFWYWYAVYDPATRRLVRFSSNGYA